MDFRDLPVDLPVSVRVTIDSEQEPVFVDGAFTPRIDGFDVVFALGADRFAIASVGNEMTLTADGATKYKIVLQSDGAPTRAVLDTPFGKLEFSITPTLRELDYVDSTLHIVLGYTLSAPTVGAIDRKISVTIAGL